MPLFVQAVIAILATILLVATVVPGPRIHPARAGSACLILMTSCSLVFVGAVGVIVLGMLQLLPGPVVLLPAVAGLGVAALLCLAMCWVAAVSRPTRECEADESGEEDEGGGGGGGLRPEEDPPRDPGPSDGILWDDFDRERRAWEAAQPPVREFDFEFERELVEV